MRERDCEYVCEREKQKKKGRERELGGRKNRKIDCEVRVRVVWKKKENMRKKEEKVLPSSSNIVTIIRFLSIGMNNMSFVGVAIMTKMFYHLPLNCHLR